MVEITLRLPDEVAARLKPMGPWLSTALELTSVGFKTPAAETAAEIIHFLSTSPAARMVLAYHVSDRAQERLGRLLSLNQGGALSALEKAELDEMERIEHVVVMLKAQARDELDREQT
jgi:hypothetical protein